MKNQATKPAPYASLAKEGQLQELVSGLFWLRLPLPFELDHVNCWLLKDGDDWSIVDSGFNYGDTLAHWESILAGKSVKDVFITHFHPDHFGLAGWLAEKTGASVTMTPGEEKMVRSLMDGDKLEALYRPYYIEAGLDPELLETMVKRRLLYKKVVSKPPEKIRNLSLGEKVTLGGKDCLLTGGGGHSPEHACLYNTQDKILIAGDIVLPTITPNISFFPGNLPGHDPVQNYFDTLDRVAQDVPDDVVVLPSHGDPFTGLHARIAEIKDHHERRLQKIREICAEPMTALEATLSLFSHRELGPHDMFFAIGETLAHLVHDEKRGKIQMANKDGVSFYKSIK